MLPRLPSTNRVDRPLRYTITSGDGGGVIPGFFRSFDDRDVLGFEFHDPIRLCPSASTFPTDLHGMAKVLALSDVLQVLHSVVGLYAISVIDLFPSGSRPNKRFGNKLMDEPVFPTIGTAQKDPMVATFINFSGHDSTDNVPTQTLGHTLSDARVRNVSTKSSHNPVRTNFVSPLVANNGTPFFVHGRHYTTGGM
jgi:hypothetical protein